MAERQAAANSNLNGKFLIGLQTRSLLIDVSKPAGTKVTPIPAATRQIRV